MIKSGTDSEYRMLHYWVERQLGKPKVCWECGTTESKYYDWANKAGKYMKDISDWERLCKRCHIKKDRRYVIFLEYCKRGHKMVISNLYIYPRSKKLQCKKCRMIWRQQYNTKQEDK